MIDREAFRDWPTDDDIKQQIETTMRACERLSALMDLVTDSTCRVDEVACAINNALVEFGNIPYAQVVMGIAAFYHRILNDGLRFEVDGD